MARHILTKEERQRGGKKLKGTLLAQARASVAGRSRSQRKIAACLKQINSPAMQSRRFRKREPPVRLQPRTPHY